MASLGCIRRLLGDTLLNETIISLKKKKTNSYVHGILVPASKSRLLLKLCSNCKICFGPPHYKKKKVTGSTAVINQLLQTDEHSRKLKSQMTEHAN